MRRAQCIRTCGDAVISKTSDWALARCWGFLELRGEDSIQWKHNQHNSWEYADCCVTPGCQTWSTKKFQSTKKHQRCRQARMRLDRNNKPHSRQSAGKEKWRTQCDGPGPVSSRRESNERAWKTRHGMGFRFKSRRPFYYPWEVVFIFGHQNASLLKRRERIVRAEQTGTCNQ